MAKTPSLNKKKSSHNVSMIKSPQPSTKHKQTIIHLSNQRALDRFAAAHSFKYLQKESPMNDVEKKLYISPVSLLGHQDDNEQCFGIFAKEAMDPKGSINSISRRLGEYLGKSVHCVNTDDYEGDSAYLFVVDETELGFSKAIDAKSERNWTAFVNSASCAATANIGVYIDHGIIYYYLKRSIKADEQLLIYYGDLYSSYYADLAGGIRFLKPADSGLESYALFQQNKALYQPELQSLEPGLAQLFELDPMQTFVVPVEADLDAPFADTPLLAFDLETQQLLPQHEQENMTSLMLACWQGNEPRIRALLMQGANPNIQSSISGFSPLHLVIVSPTLNDTTKKMLVKLLVEYHAEMHLQDKNERSIVHWAFSAKNVGMVKFLIEENRLHISADQENSLLDRIDKDDRDVFLWAIAEGSFELVDYLKSSMTEKDIEHYLDNDSFKGALEHLLDNVSDLEEIHRILDAIKSISMSNVDFRTQLTSFILSNIQRACIRDMTGYLPNQSNLGTTAAQTKALAIATHFFMPENSAELAPAKIVPVKATRKTSSATPSKKTTSKTHPAVNVNEYGRFYPSSRPGPSVARKLRKDDAKMSLRVK